MGITRETMNHEWHAVQCGICARKNIIKVRSGQLDSDPRFDEQNRFVCAKCARRKK